MRFGKGGTVSRWAPASRSPRSRAEHAVRSSPYKNPAAARTRSYVGGEPAGFIIELENGFKIYHMGDTGLFGDMNLIGSYYKPDLVLIPIGGHFVMTEGRRLCDPRDDQAEICHPDALRHHAAV